MGVSTNLQEMIAAHYDPSSWQSCGQEDDICINTRFVVATTMPNTGFMCGGDGCVFGDWAWFNYLDEYIDYITHYVIPMHLCEMEEQDPQVVMTGMGDERIFNLSFAENHLPIKDELQRLWQELNALKKNGATYLQVKAALLESSRRNSEMDGEMVFGFICFDGCLEACEELLHRISPLDENRKIVETIIKRQAIRADENERLKDLFAEYSIM